ncbi:hypothetical protein C8T65DRAFT_630417 [Cerioporus squamosus]|nr:hypothetical protein C8T65DRAFT_630417 [Cerioporus squamosus]
MILDSIPACYWQPLCHVVSHPSSLSVPMLDMCIIPCRSPTFHLMLKKHQRSTPACIRCHRRRAKCVDVPGMPSCLRCLKDDTVCERPDGTCQVRNTSGKPRRPPTPRSKRCCSACTRSKTRCSRDPSGPCPRCIEKSLSCSFLSVGKPNVTGPQQPGLHGILSRTSNETSSYGPSILPATYPLSLSNVRLPRPPARTSVLDMSALPDKGPADTLPSRFGTPPPIPTKQSGKWCACNACADKKVACLDVLGASSCLRCLRREMVCERAVGWPAGRRESEETASVGRCPVREPSSASQDGVVGIVSAHEQGLILDHSQLESTALQTPLSTSSDRVRVSEAAGSAPRTPARRSWWDVCMAASPDKQS